MYTAQLPEKGVFVIRYPRGRGSVEDWRCPLEEVAVGKGRKLKEGHQLAVITLGPIGTEAAKAIRIAEEQNAEGGLSVAHYDMRFLKPIDEDILNEVGTRFDKVITVEDGVLKGGLGSAVLEYMNNHDFHPHIKMIGLPDSFVEQGSVSQLRSLLGMDAEHLADVITQMAGL